MWELDDKESWVPKNWYFWTVVLEKTLESLLHCKEIKPVNPKWNQSWIFIGRTDAEAEPPTLWPPEVKNWLIGKDPDAGKDWKQEEKKMTEDEMIGWHDRLDGCEFEQAPGVGDRWGGLACCHSWGHRVGHDWELNWIAASEIRNPGAGGSINVGDFVDSINLIWWKILGKCDDIMDQENTGRPGLSLQIWWFQVLRADKIHQAKVWKRKRRKRRLKDHEV